MWTRNNVTFVWVWFTWRKESHSIYNTSVSQALVSLVRHIQEVLRREEGCFWDNSTAQTPPLSGQYYHPAFAPATCPAVKAVGCVYKCQGSVFSCVFIKQTGGLTQQSKHQLKSSLTPQWQWVCQASNSSARQKITILWFYFVAEPTSHQGHTQNCTELPGKGHQPQHSQGWAATGEALRDTQNMFGMTECTKTVQPCTASCFQKCSKYLKLHLPNWKEVLAIFNRQQQDTKVLGDL